MNNFTLDLHVCIVIETVLMLIPANFLASTEVSLNSIPSWLAITEFNEYRIYFNNC